MSGLFTRIVALAAVCFLALTLSSCGGENKAALDARAAQAIYVKQLNEAQGGFTSAITALNIDSTLSRKEYQLALLKLEPLLVSLGDDLKAIKPPTLVASQHSQLVALAYDYGKVINNNADDITSKNSAMSKDAIATIQEKSTKFSTDFADVISDINNKLTIPQQ